jgi:hypothetical protein
VRENADGTPREIDWVFETEGDRVVIYVAFVQGKRPRPDKNTGKVNRVNALGWIIYQVKRGRLILVNKNTALSRQVWTMGHTNKGHKEHHIGGHGTPEHYCG